MTRFQRARKPAEKDLRRKAILDAARELAVEAGPIALGLNELGRRSGVTKSNLYRYFESREHVLLTLLTIEGNAMVDALEAELATKRALGSVADGITRAVLSQPLACQLLGMAASILEHNLTAEAIVGAKIEMSATLGRAAVALRRALPWLSAPDAGWALATLITYVCGLWPAANPSPVAAEVLARPQFAHLRTDGPRDLRRFVEVLLTGLKAG